MKKIIYALIIAAAVLLVPFLYRNETAAASIPGEEVYYHIIAANNPENFYFSNFDYLVRGALLVGIDLRILAGLIGLMSCIFLSLILHKLRVPEKISFYTTLILVLSPAFIFAFSTVSSETLSLLLILIGTYMLLSNKSLYLSIIPFVLSVKGIFTAITVMAVLVSFMMLGRENRKKIFLVAGMFIVFCTAYYIILTPPLYSEFSSSRLGLFGELFSDIGGHYGLSIFAAIFAVAGFFSVKKRLSAYPLILVLLVAFFFKPSTLVYSNVIISCFAGAGVNNILERKWKTEMLKEVITYALICGILLSAISQVNIVSNMPPSNSLIDAAKWLRQNSESDAVIFSSEENAFFVGYFGNRSTLISPASRYSEGFSDLEQDYKTILYSRNLIDTENTLKKHRIGYILIDDRMRSELLQYPDEGLLFTTTNKDKFATVYSKDGTKVIYYTENI